MGRQVVLVLVIDEADPHQGRTVVFDSAEEARRFIEHELANQRPPEHLRAFVGTETPIEVSYRPIVSLGPRGQQDQETIPQEFHSEASPNGQASVTGETASSAGEPEEEAVAEAGEEDRPYEKDGVRFSSLFKPSS